MTTSSAAARSDRQIRRWRQYLADERAEAAVYRELAERRTGEEREILLALADAERRHESHWLDLLGDDAGPPRRSSVRTRLLVFLAAHFGTVFVLALMQRAEGRSPYEDDADATDRWPPTSGSTARCCAGWRPAAASSCPAPSGRRCSAPTTAWSATSRWCSASARPACRHPHRPVHRHRRPAGRRAVDGRGGVRLGAVPARAAAVDPARPGVAVRPAASRRGRQRAGPGLPGPRHGPDRGRGSTPRRCWPPCTWTPTRRPGRRRRPARGGRHRPGARRSRASASSPPAR